MNFEFDDEQRTVRDVTRRFLTERATVPAKIRYDESPEGFDRAVWREIAELGWLQFAATGDKSEICHLGILAEEIGRASFASPFLHCVQCALLLARAGAPQALLARIADGSRLMGVLRPETSRTHLQFDHNLLSGQHFLLEWGSGLDTLIVPLGEDSTYALVLVDLASRGVKREAVKTFDNSRSCTISFNDVAIDPHAIFSISAEDWREISGLSELLFDSEAVGGAYGAVELTAEYTRERKQFGHPIAAFQAVRHGLADVRALADAAWLAVWDGIGTAIRGESLAGRPALATWVSKRAFQEAALKGSQYHGGMGHVVESHMQFFYRRAGSFHGRVRSEWDLLGEIAAHYVAPHLSGSARSAIG